MLVTDRRRSFGMHEERHEQGPGQGSLFAPDSLAPPARPPGPTPDPFARARGPAAPAPPREEPAPIEAAAPAPPVAEPDEALAPPDYLDDLEELEPAHARPVPVRSLLAGPTLDDVMSRAWEGLRAEVPTPCPVCHTEIEPSARGRCGACGSTLD
jgi:hypothetical protein